MENSSRQGKERIPGSLSENRIDGGEGVVEDESMFNLNIKAAASSPRYIPQPLSLLAQGFFRLPANFHRPF